MLWSGRLADLACDYGLWCSNVKLKERHMHECRQGLNCGGAPLHDTAAESHTLFNPAPPEARLKAESYSLY